MEKEKLERVKQTLEEALVITADIEETLESMMEGRYIYRLPLCSGRYLAIDSEYPNTIHVGITSVDGTWLQDIVIIKEFFKVKDRNAVKVLVFGDDCDTDYTANFTIPTV